MGHDGGAEEARPDNNNDDGENASSSQQSAEKKDESSSTEGGDDSDTGAIRKAPDAAATEAAQEGTDEEGGIGGAIMDKLQDMLVGDLSNLELDDGLRGPPPVLDSFDLEGVASYIKEGKAKKIVVMCGAGISVSAGIPDFRTPGTGLYDNLQKFGLPHPEAVFDIDYFREKPEPFYLLAKELFPGGFLPTPTHHFINLLHNKGLLLRCFTQNIDSLESEAGLPSSALVAAHGNFDAASCIDCDAEYTQAFAKAAVDEGVPPKCKDCGGLVKPDIVFFGEALPEKFHTHVTSDMGKADLLIVLGTSLQVQPFASLIDMVLDNTPRLLINRERVGERPKKKKKNGFEFFMGPPDRGFNFDAQEGNYRDALFLGNCDDGVHELSKILGWEEDLKALIDAGASRKAAAP